MVKTRSATTHLPDEDPDEPEPTCDARHEDVEEEVADAVAGSHDVIPFSKALSLKTFLRDKASLIALSMGESDMMV